MFFCNSLCDEDEDDDDDGYEDEIKKIYLNRQNENENIKFFFFKIIQYNNLLFKTKQKTWRIEIWDKCIHFHVYIYIYIYIKYIIFFYYLCGNRTQTERYTNNDII